MASPTDVPDLRIATPNVVSVLVDAREAAEILGVHPQTVKQYGRLGVLEQRKIGPRLVRYRRSDVMRLALGDDAA